MHPFPEQSEFLEFFGAEPELTDGGVVWFYNRLAFDFSVGAGNVRIEMEPASGILHVVWSEGEMERMRLDLNRVSGLILEREESQDTMVVRLSHLRANDLRLRLRPTLHLQWGDKA